MLGVERDIPQNHAASVVAEADMIEVDVTDNLRQRKGSRGIDIFGLLGQYLVRTLQTRDGFGELGADRNHLHNGSDQKAEE